MVTVGATAADVRPTRVRTLTQVAAVGAAAAGSLLLLRLVDPHQPGHYPLCPLYAMTGWYCPGCGALRAVHDLTFGNLPAAWAMNPLAVLAVPYLVYSWLAWLRRGVTGGARRRLAPGWLILSIGIAIVAFGVLRNVPALNVLAPH